MHKKFWGVSLVWLLLALWPPAVPAQSQRAQPPITPPQLQVNSTAAGLLFTWQFPNPQDQSILAATATSALTQFPKQRYGGYQWPLQTALVLLADNAPLVPQFAQFASIAWSQLPPLAEPLLTPGAAVGLVNPRPPESLAPPTAPVFLVREGRMRGQRVGVVAFSPLYQAADGLKLATHLQVLWPSAQPLPTTTALAATMLANRHAQGNAPPGPANPAVTMPGLKVLVSQSGMQQLTGASLLAAGFAAGLKLAQLHLTQAGSERPLEVIDTDGLLDATSELRFYLPHAPYSMAVGDRWNRTETCWLTLETTPGLRMQQRVAPPTSAPVRLIAFENGIAEANQLYESTMAGGDGDHWFWRQMSLDGVAQGVPVPYVTNSFTLTHTLPLVTTAAYTSVFTVTGSSRTIATNVLRASVGDMSQTFTWTSQAANENWQQTLVSSAHTAQLDLLLFADRRPIDLRIDKIAWRQPVSLNFAGRGAVFSGVAGLWQYQLSAVPTAGALYDVTDDRQPQRLQVPWGNTVYFEDGPAVHDYLVAGPNTLHTPQLQAYQTAALNSALGADIVYITPAPLRAALAPLVAYRQAQGYRVLVVDVQDIYDAWTAGQVSPSAIRNFLRYAVYTWQPAPSAAVLVGDATTDPLDYRGNHQTNWLPAYLADVDPWQGEAACENCYAQLDDDDPLAGPQDPGFLPDIWLGRFSVQDAQQLTTVVAKLLHYETQDLSGRAYSSLYVADDYIHPDGSIDEGGDFAAYSDLVVVGAPNQQIPPLQAPQLAAMRLYYDPRPGGVTDPWREPDAVKAHQRVLAAFQKGPTLISFNGHANQFQWATTVTNVAEPYLFGINDIFALHNLDQLPIILEMTCYTAQFVQDSPSGTTIDESFQRHPDGGAVAIWGSAGLTVADGHDALMRGFQTELWRRPPLTARLGELITAGYLEQFSTETCCQEVRRLYLLLGDPLTPARVWAPTPLFLPLIQR